MEVVEIERRLAEDFPNNKIKAIEGFSSSEEFRKICLSIDGKDHSLTSRKVESIEELVGFHGVTEEDIKAVIYDAIKFEVGVFLGR